MKINKNAIKRIVASGSIALIMIGLSGCDREISYYDTTSGSKSQSSAIREMHTHEDVLKEYVIADVELPEGKTEPMVLRQIHSASGFWVFGEIQESFYNVENGALVSCKTYWRIEEDSKNLDNAELVKGTNVTNIETFYPFLLDTVGTKTTYSKEDIKKGMEKAIEVRTGDKKLTKK